ncbi:hypothetical protein [Kitasatospora sp. NPDC018619]|uniref:hypothetical protein n=1 Tax=unclassified Kitasatospora TaxID=2633591 RepID=UPI0037981275
MVRVAAAGTGAAAGVALASTQTSTATPALEVTAVEPGPRGAAPRVSVDYLTPTRASLQPPGVGTSGTVRAAFADLSVRASDPRFAEAVVDSGSAVVRVKVLAESRPDRVGTVSERRPGCLASDNGKPCRWIATNSSRVSPGPA